VKTDLINLIPMAADVTFRQHQKYDLVICVLDTERIRSWSSSSSSGGGGGGGGSTCSGGGGSGSNSIQGVSRLVDITARGDFLGLCDKKSSYKHVSDFRRLRSYDRLKLRIESNDYWQ